MAFLVTLSLCLMFFGPLLGKWVSAREGVRRENAMLLELCEKSFKTNRKPALDAPHGCFWRYHSECAWAWELRLQDEIQADFKITESPYSPGGRNLGDLGDGPHRDAYLREHAAGAIAAIEKEAGRRMGRSKNRKLVPSMTILESVFWSNYPADIWAMEIRLSQKQGIEFRLLSPNEDAARTTFSGTHHDEVRNRETILKTLVAPTELFERKTWNNMKKLRRMKNDPKQALADSR